MKKITALDIIITSLAVVLVLTMIGVTALFHKQSDSLTIRSKETYTYQINQNREIRIPGVLGTTVIEIKDRKFRFIESPCDNKTCIHQGWMGISGMPVICLPNRVSCMIGDDKNQNEIDGVSY